MNKTYYQFLATIIAITFFIQSSQEIYSQEALSADTPFVEVNGKIIKFGSAIIAFSKLQQRNMNFDKNTIFSQIVQQLVNEELLSQKIDSIINVINVSMSTYDKDSDISKISFFYLFIY